MLNYGAMAGFFTELRDYLGGARRWIRLVLIILAALVLLVVLFGSLESLPFIYDAF